MLKYISLFIIISFVSCDSNSARKTKTHYDPTIQANVITTIEDDTIPAVDSSIVKRLMGRFDPAQDSSFMKIPIMYADEPGRYMQKEAFSAFQKMYDAALSEGIKLKIKSAARNFDYQKGIWERKWTGETKLSSGEDASVAYTDSVDRALNILKYSSMPGTSRHHWGTDIDLNAFDNNWFETGEGLKLFQWLESHGHEYGFCRPYTAKDEQRPDGYNEEKWHWSYMPISEPLTRHAVTMLSDSLISGFLGSGTASKIDVVNKYVLGINQSCVH